MFRQDGSCPALLEDLALGFPYGAVTRYGAPFQTLPVPKSQATGLIRFRSPLLTESRLMSFPPATEMFQFAGFASCAYGFSAGYRLRGGLPHSEIPGSTIARISPGLFAACHVLHRLSVPRHPPDALLMLLTPHPTASITRLRAPCARSRTMPRRKPGPIKCDIPLHSEDTSCGIRHSAACTAPGHPARSQLASSQLSINNTPPARWGRRGNSVILPRCPSGVRPLSAFATQTPVAR